ncbi:family 78 glycoside hydrolase catalytic domain [Cellulophaga sp. HaHaR_3_176]|uniref:family 78 glycoside hydrolase catalytic domain n=1 Tax=Cellulophaga sp. HaHaR_3_176 TaxID=1942464 RepID=UPI001C1FF21B|nr:family 78 glycoside hydrolase catalytic domain [Cellulophaga sp. HaHaR_3_176]QWX82819.1 family 78 glycoside hydrolase catalytic domain [Cellulophaga sp. HaHaR_3_176]
MKKHIVFLLFIAFITKIQAQNNSGNVELETTLISPKKITKLSEGSYLIDFGKAFFGTVQLESKKAQNDSLVFHLGEKLDNQNKVDRNPGGTIRYQKVVLNGLSANKNNTLTLSPDKRNTSGAAILLPESIGVIMPFRYCEIENLNIPIEEIQFSQKAIHNRFNDNASDFTSSNKVLDSIWDLCKHTIKATSFTGYYVDGDRERIPYEADAYINQLSHYSVDSVYTIGRRTNEYFIDNPTWPTEWLLHTVLMFYTDYMYTGDLTPLEEHYENLKLKTLMDLEREDGLISSSSPNLNRELIKRLGFKKPDTKIKDIIDWPPAQKDTGWKLATAEGERDGYEIVPVNTVVNSFYYYNLKLMTEIAGFLDKKEDVIFFKNKAAAVKNVINTKLFDAEKGYYIDGENSTHASLHGNMLPLAFDLVPDEHIKSVTSFVKTRGMACSVYGAQYLLEGLFKNGEAQYGFDLITETEGDRNWWNMIEVGATMTMEAWDVKYKPNSDWNHAWGTAPLNIITRYMWGVKPKTAGFKIAEIKPQLAELSHTTIKVPTKNGIISGTYEKDEKSELYTIEIPEGITAEFTLPSNQKKGLLNGKKIKNNKTVIILNSGINKIQLKQ